MSTCWIGQGMHLVGWTGRDQRFYFVNRLARRAWLGVSLSLTDVLDLKDETARLALAQCLALSTTRRACVEQLAKMDGFRPL
jgi:hypothetical protein